MASVGDGVSSGFSGSGTSIDGFKPLNGSTWNIQNKVVTVGATYRALLVHETARVGGPFSVSATVKAKGADQTWNGVVANCRPNGSGSGFGYLTLRVRQGRGAVPEWQLLDADTAVVEADANVLAKGLLAGADPSRPWRVTLSRDVAGNLGYAVEQGGEKIGSGVISPASPIVWLNDACVGVYSLKGDYAEFSDFQATMTPGMFENFQRSRDPGSLESQQLAGRWQEDLDDWVIKDGAARACGLTGSAKEGILLYAQPFDDQTQAYVSADVKMNDTTSWTGLVFGARNEEFNRHPDNYFAFQIKDGEWRVIHRIQSSHTTTILSQSDTGFELVACATYRLRVQFGSATSVRICVTQNGSSVLAERTVTLTPTPNGARFGIFSGGTSNAFTQVAALPVAPKSKAPPAIKRDTSGKWSAVWTPNATYWSSPYKVSTLVPLEDAPVNCAFNDSVGEPQQCLYTVTDTNGAPKRQYVGYYATGGVVAITKRIWSESTATWGPFEPSVPLDTRFPEPDGHYRIAIAESADGHVHVVANMWAGPLVYYRTTQPGNLASLKRQETMVSRDVEAQCTYPAFMNVDGRLLYFYRCGGSGDGTWIINEYHNAASPWSRLSTVFDDKSKTDKTRTYSAYPAMRAPVLGPDGQFHLAWIWRSIEKPMINSKAESNSRICYACSSDLINWRSASGESIATPIAYDEQSVIVDDVPERGGALNGLVSLGFDNFKKPVIGYVRFDDLSPGDGTAGDAYLNGPGSSQFFVARWQDKGNSGSWQRTQLTNYVGRWAPQGTSSIETPFNIAEAALRYGDAGKQLLTLPYIYGSHGGIFVLDIETLEVVGEQEWRSYADLVKKAGMRTIATKDSSQAMFGADKDEEYVLFNFSVPNRASLLADADTSMRVLRVR